VLRWSILGLWLPTSALAGDCVVAYTADRIELHASLIRDALAQDDFDLAQQTARLIAQGLPCLDVVVAPDEAREASLAVAAAFTASGLREEALPWLRLAVSIDDAPPDHAVLDPVWGRALQTLQAPVEDLSGVLGVGSFYLDGLKVEVASYRPGQHHLLQRVGLDGSITSWLLLEGWPAEALVEEDARARMERLARAQVRRVQRDGEGSGVMVTDAGDVVVHREFPKHRAPVLAIGSTALATGLGLVVAHLVDARAFAAWDDPTSREQIDQRASRVNALLIAGVAVAAVGTAGLTWGLLIEDRAVGVSLRVPLGPRTVR
jgi:hypothetical protein